MLYGSKMIFKKKELFLKKCVDFTLFTASQENLQNIYLVKSLISVR